MPSSNLSFEKVLLVLSFVFAIMLGVNDELSLYIHPRYILFTIIFSIIGLAILFLGRKEEHSHAVHGSKLSLIPLLFILFASLLLPARSLSSATVSQRTIDSGSLVTSTDAEPTSTLFAGSSKSLKLFDWARLIQTNSDPDYYANKPVKISGFVYDAGLGGDTVWLTRFVLTCCAVDAQPVGIPVQIKDWQNQYEEDQWLEVEGEFVQKDLDDDTRIELSPSSISEIERPQNPYEG